MHHILGACESVFVGLNNILGTKSLSTYSCGCFISSEEKVIVRYKKINAPKYYSTDIVVLINSSLHQNLF